MNSERDTSEAPTAPSRLGTDSVVCGLVVMVGHLMAGYCVMIVYMVVLGSLGWAAHYQVASGVALVLCVATTLLRWTASLPGGGADGDTRCPWPSRSSRCLRLACSPLRD